MLNHFSTPAVLLYGIAIAGVLVYLPFLVVAYQRIQIGAEALAAPRAMLDKLPAYAKRAAWAHQNAFEAFTLFAAAALMAYVTQVDSPIAIAAVATWLTARLFYSLFYILNIPLLRSLTFALGSLGTATLMGLSLIKVTG